MKKVLSIVLSICLIVASISAVLTQSVSAAEATTEVVFDENTIIQGTEANVDEFYNPANWFWSNSTTLNMLAEDAKNENAMKAGTVDYTSDGKAIQSNVNPYAKQFYVPFTVEKNTSYRLTFKVRNDSITSATSLSSVSGIVNPDYANTTAVGTPSTDHKTLGGVHELLVNSGSFRSPYAQAGKYTVTSRKASVEFKATPGEWLEVSYTFNSLDYTTMYYFLRGSVGSGTDHYTYYFDDFKLYKDYYNVEDTLFWRTYKYNDSTYGSTLGGTTTFNGITSGTGLGATNAGTGGAIGYTTAAGYFNDTDDDNGYSIH